MKTLMLGLTTALFLFDASNARAQDRSCSVSDFQACKTCAQLDAAVDLKQPDAGDYYRGAQWNGLYSAYVLNCPIIAAKLIKAGASPANGGSSGSMILTVASKWPHNDKKINDAWTAMLLLVGVDMNSPLKSQNNQSTKDVLAEDSSYKPDYFDLFILFQK